MEFSVFSHHGYLNICIVHLPLESFFQSEQGCVDGILDLHIWFESFL